MSRGTRGPALWLLATLAGALSATDAARGSHLLALVILLASIVAFAIGWAENGGWRA